MKKFIKKIKDWLLNLYLNIDGGLIQYSYLDIYQPKRKENDFLISYIEKKAKELAEKEGIKIYFTSFDEMNKNETVEENKAIGTFRYLKSENIVKYQNIVTDYVKKYGNFDLPKDYIFPRIEISEKGNVFTILHELGHYFLFKRNEEQSEKLADLFIEEFFEKYLPPFFKWIYQIDIAIRKKEERKFSSLECYFYYKDYKQFCKKYKL